MTATASCCLNATRERVWESQGVEGMYLDTGRLRLREWRPEDRPPFAALNADPEVMEYFPSVLSAAESDALADRIEGHFEQYGYGLWAVEPEQTGDFIGFVGLNRPDFSIPAFDGSAPPVVEIGWRLARSAWGQGYASEAARAALRFAFETLELPQIFSFTVPANRRSRRVMERIGLERHVPGDFQHPKLPVGHPLRQHALYRLGRERWLEASRQSVR